MAIARLGAQQELQQAQATAEGWPIGQRVARDDQRLGDRGVCVAQPLLRPGPPGIAGLRPGDRGQRVREQPPGSDFTGSFSEQLSGAQRGKRHRPDVRGAALCRYAEPAERLSPHARRLRTRGCDTETPERPAPPVTHRCFVAPSPVHGHPVVTGPRRIERVEDEGEVAAGQTAGGRPGFRLMAHDDQPAGGVVDAIAVLAPGDRMQSVLEEPAVVGEPFEVIEHRRANAGRGSHAATLDLISRPVSSRYWSAMTGHSSCGAVAVAVAAILAITSPCVITERSAAAIAAGSRCGTSRPAPPASTSLACGNCVATTGLPAATASMSTPEVTCSAES